MPPNAEAIISYIDLVPFTRRRHRSCSPSGQVRLSPGPCGGTRTAQREKNVDNGREQGDAARLMRRREGHRHEIQQRGDTERGLHVGHRERGRGREARRRGLRRRDIGRHHQHAVVELHGRRILEQVAPEVGSAFVGGCIVRRDELAERRREAAANEWGVETRDECA
jgi:hypothetical protein